MKNDRSNSAVSEIIGTMLLLIIAVAAFSTVYMNVLSDEGPTPYIHNTIVSYVDGLNIVLEHHGGDPLSLDTLITITIGPSKDIITPKEYLSAKDKADGEWNVGEQIIYPIDDISPMTCTYGSPALDYQPQQIEDPQGGESSEVNFSKIIESYDGPTDISSVDLNIQWSKGTTKSELKAIDPEKNIIAFQGPLNVAHLLDYEEWIFSEGVKEITIKFEYVDGKGGNNNKLFYYFDRSKDDITIRDDLYNKATSPGYVTENITVDAEMFSRIGFGIKSNSQYWFTNVPMNDNEVKQALVYNLGKTTLGPEGSYLIGFEDLDRINDPHCDNDFQDLVIIVHIVGCS
jgi:hypothetical protein